MVVRTNLPPAASATAIREALRSVAPDIPRNEFSTLQELVDRAVSPRRFVVVLLGGFAAFALVLAAMGIYAVVSYSVTQRKAEWGIRTALGASASTLQIHVLLQSLRLVGLGALIGGVAASILARSLESLLYSVRFTDPATFLGTLVFLTAVGGLAGYIPALRASRIDPIAALRSN
jgi:ABC-type antimicrobial peptide transport system permease subunit